MLDFAPAHVDDGSHDVAYHVAQKTPALDAENDLLAFDFHLEFRYLPDPFLLGLVGSERTEIFFPDKVFDGFFHLL